MSKEYVDHKYKQEIFRLQTERDKYKHEVRRLRKLLAEAKRFDAYGYENGSNLHSGTVSR